MSKSGNREKQKTFRGQRLNEMDFLFSADFEAEKL